MHGLTVFSSINIAKIDHLQKKLKFNDAEGFFKLTTWDVESTFAISPMTMDTLTFKGEASLPPEKEIKFTNFWSNQFLTAGYSLSDLGIHTYVC